MNNKIIGLFMVMLLSLTLVSALDFDNVKVTEEDYIVIKNMFNLPIIGEDIARLSTTTPNGRTIFINDPNMCESYERNIGYNCLIAEYTINSYSNFEGALDNNKFYNLKKDMKEEARDYTIKYKVEDGVKEVKDYKENCIELENKSTSCYQVESGVHYENKYKWIEKEDLNIKEEDITIGIFTNVKDGEVTEWIPKLFGVEVDEWLAFEGALKLEYAVSASTNYDNPYDSNAKAMPFRQGLVGIDGDYEIDGVSLFFKKLNSPTCIYNISITAIDGGLVPTGAPLSKGIYDSSTAPASEEFVNITMSPYTLINGTGYAIVVNESGAGGCDSTNNVEWHMVGAIYPDPGAWTRFTGGAWQRLTANDFGFMVWGSIPATTPVVTLNSPVDYANFSTNSVTFNCSATDDGVVQNISLIIDDTIEATTSGGFLEESITPLADGAHTWTCNATDDGNLVGTLATRTITIDTTPAISFVNPTQPSFTNTSRNYVPINVSLTETYFKNITFNIYGAIDYSYFYTNETRSINVSLADGTYEYNVTTWTTTGQTNTTATRTITIDTTPAISFVNPTQPSFTNQSSSYVPINVSLTETYFKNLTFRIYKDTGSTIQYSYFFTNSTRFINVSLTDRIHEYNVTICTTTNRCNTTETRTITTDTIAPSINIVYPTNTTYIVRSPTYVIDLNYTYSDLHTGTCWYNNETANVTIACGTNATINITGGYHTFILYANDTLGNEANTSVTFFLNTIVESATYSTPVMETQTQNFLLNITADTITSFNSSLIYNGTARTTTYNLLGESTSSFELTQIGNISFYWDYWLNGNNYTSSTYYQVVNGIENLNVTAGTCDAELSNAMCWDFKNEGNLTSYAEDVDYNFRYGITNTSSKIVYGSLSNVSTFCLCVNSTLYNSYTMGRGEIQYSKSGFTDRRFYTFSVNRISNVTINNTLYSLPNGDATSFLFDFEDSALSPYVGKYASLLRWYPDLDEYKVVEMAETDDKGETIMRVKVEDVDYRVALYHQNGTLIKLLNAVRFACLTSPCTYSIPIGDTETDFTSVFGVEGGITYNETSKVFTFVWNDPTQNTDQMRLLVTRERGDSAYTICDTSATGFTGVLTCDSTGYTGSLKAIGYRTASPEIPLFQLFINTITSPFKGDLGLFMSLIIFMVMVLIGVFSPVASVVLGLVALYPAYLLGSITLPVMIGIAVLGGIVIHFAKRTG